MSDGMMKGLLKPTLIGTVLQVAMVVIGHNNEAVALQFGPVGTTLSLITGFLATRMNPQPGAGGAAGGGALAGGISALLGTIVSNQLGDVPMSILAVGGGSGLVAGALGGLLGRLGGKKS